MAKVAITNTKLDLNSFADANFVAGSTDGITFDFKPDTEKLLLVFQNTAAAAGTVIVKAGNGIQGVADTDAHSIPASGISFAIVESGAFKNVSGDDKGKVVVVPSAATIKACAIQLP